MEMHVRRFRAGVSLIRAACTAAALPPLVYHHLKLVLLRLDDNHSKIPFQRLDIRSELGGLTGLHGERRGLLLTCIRIDVDWIRCSWSSGFE